MRGDSLRDLYAKVLALCGLGLLAGAGALVDYWPVQGELPRVASRRPELLRVSVPRAVSMDTRVMVPAAFRTDAPKRAPVPDAVTAARAVTPRVVLQPVPASFEVPVDRTLVGFVTASPGVTEFPGPPPVFESADAQPPTPSLPAPVAGLPALEPSLPGIAPAPIAALDGPANHGGDGDGFLAGAIKKTGAVASASIAKTGDVLAKGGAVAGASIVDVFRGLAGAVKKVSPFVP